jgi:hypothetical protein
VFDPIGLDDNEGVTVVSARPRNPAVPCTVAATCRQFNPFTETPVEGTDWRRNSNFGQAANNLDFQTPRTFRFSVGFRF